MTRSYKLYFSSITSGDSKASIKIVRAGIITSVAFIGAGLGGIGIDTYIQLELSKQSASSFAINDTPATVIAECCASAGAIASASFGTNYSQVGMQNPVEVGDNIYVHQVVNGTAPAANKWQVVVTVNEP